MKVLTHEGVVLTLPFMCNDIPPNTFERLDGQGTATVGIVAEADEATVRRQIRKAAQLERVFNTEREITNDTRFIARVLFDIPNGTEIRLEIKNAKIKLVIPPDAKPTREPIHAGDRIAINHRARPKTLMNAHGTVESVKGDKATIKLDESDRQRVIRATGREVETSFPAPLAILDKLDDAK